MREWIRRYWRGVVDKVLAFTISRANTPQRIEMFRRMLEGCRNRAGLDFDGIAYCFTKEAFEVGRDWKDWSWVDYGENVGQHVVTNDVIEVAKVRGYKYLLRLDDDCTFLTNGWLRKMVEAGDVLGEDFIIGPKIKGLLNPPQKTESVEVEGIKLRFYLGAMGGVCRLHRVSKLTNPHHPYISDVRSPLGFGDATGIAKWAAGKIRKDEDGEVVKDTDGNPILDHKAWLVELEHVIVKHGTKRQREEDPEYHEWQPLAQHIPYIPLNIGESGN